MTAVSLRSDRLIERLRAIPEGQVAETARRAGITYRQLLRLRSGTGIMGVRLSTLEKLAEALDEPVGVLLGETGAPPPRERAQRRGPDDRQIQQMVRRFQRVADEAAAAADVLRGSIQQQFDETVRRAGNLERATRKR